MEFRELPVPDGLAGQRVDAAIARLLGFSRTFAAETIENGTVTVGGVVASKSDRLQTGQWLRVEWQPREGPRVVPTDVPELDIVHDDDDIVVVDKPAGVAAHPSMGWKGPTVLGALAGAGFSIATSGPAERAGIVHRLDAGTSGLMVVAKTEVAYSGLKRAFHDREVTKIYHTVVQGHPDPFSGTIEAPIARHPKHDWKFSVQSSGKRAVTHYQTIEAFPFATLLEVSLETGRTHQIRVHMAALKHPCVGDPLYGSDPHVSERLGLSRQWLHAKRLGFVHPATGEDVEFSAPYPRDLQAALDVLESD